MHGQMTIDKHVIVTIQRARASTMLRKKVGLCLITTLIAIEIVELILFLCYCRKYDTVIGRIIIFWPLPSAFRLLTDDNICKRSSRVHDTLMALYTSRIGGLRNFSHWVADDRFCSFDPLSNKLKNSSKISQF